ncbi:MAG: GNAT family N-acetyltransferase [Lachnospiraceae bacterium]|jgi:predicted GNAT family N-acyltransferase|nr:GNAT family N-acetyltransferase [Lachnospiraceae bacterium]MEE3462062.1 GNAT family N-acetyltransferase [Lachnospiraceae bacterium]
MRYTAKKLNEILKEDMEKYADEGITLRHDISVDDYNDLRRSVKWILLKPERAEKALRNSFYKLIAYDGDKPIGMARIVSDGGYTYFITDVIVRPEYHHRHLGSILITNLLKFIQDDLSEDETVMISLMSAYHRETFYSRFGFHTRPFGNHGCGMSMWISRIADGSVLTS